MDGKSEALFEAHKKAILAEAARRYGIDAAALKRLGSFESFVYEYEQGGRSYIMKISHSLHRTPELVRGELDWTRHLTDGGVPVSRVIPSVNQESLEIIDGRSVEVMGDDYFLIYVFEKASGRRSDRADWDDDFVRMWGQTLGRMHALAKTYVPTRKEWKRFEWHEDTTLQIDKHIPETQSAVRARCHEHVARLRSLMIDEQGYGLVHSDLHHGNFVVENGRLTVFDLDDCHYNWFAFDISIPLFYALRDHQVDPDDKTFARFFMHRLMEGYRRENRIDAVWLTYIPDFLKLREMDLYMVIYAENAADTNGWCRRFMENRQYRIEHDIPVIDLDFSEFG